MLCGNLAFGVLSLLRPHGQSVLPSYIFCTSPDYLSCTNKDLMMFLYSPQIVLAVSAFCNLHVLIHRYTGSNKYCFKLPEFLFFPFVYCSSYSYSWENKTTWSYNNKQWHYYGILVAINIVLSYQSSCFFLLCIVLLILTHEKIKLPAHITISSDTISNGTSFSEVLLYNSSTFIFQLLLRSQRTRLTIYSAKKWQLS